MKVKNENPMAAELVSQGAGVHQQENAKPRSSKLLVALAMVAFLVAVVSFLGFSDSEESDDSAADITSEECLNELETAGLNISYPGENVYNNTYQFQLLTPRRAEAVAYPTDRSQLEQLLACARIEPVLRVSILGGQSSFVGYGFGNPGNLVISMEHFATVSFDEAEEIVTVGGGARVATVAKYLWDNYGRIFVHVRGSYVGVAGSLIGGGFGTAAGFLGIPGDRMVEVEYMLANGTIVHAGPGSDLLWAAQGAGSSFGVILSMKIQTYLHPRVNGTIAEIRSGSNLDSTDQHAEVFLALQDYGVNDAPDTLALRFHIGNSLRISMYDYGDPADFDQTLQPLLDRIANITSDFSFTEKVETSLWGMEVDSTGSSIELPLGGPVGVRAFYVQALTTQADILISKNVILTLMNTILAGAPNDETRVGGFMDFWGGVSATIDDADYSFAHGNNLWLIRSDLRLRADPTLGEDFFWPEGSEEQWKESFLAVEEALLNDGHALRGFGNYRDRLLNFDEWSDRLYGLNMERLQLIKEEVDPQGIFTNNNQSIPVCE